ncbi:MAG: response regulator [Candidatus Eremiobacteraeota bacterium]|nr:response regulator [Candidatus Eremiobacteraeota bacterium]
MGSTGGSVRLLLVDDEQMVLTTVARMLASRGYEVCTATSGGQALALASDPKEEFDLVLADLTMPDMDGIELFERLEAVRPALPKLLSSGYPPTQAQMDKIQGFLQKPYRTQELFAAVAEALTVKTS